MLDLKVSVVEVKQFADKHYNQRKFYVTTIIKRSLQMARMPR